MSAVILAGGHGSRLAASEPDPKPLVRVGSLTLLEHQLTLVERAGINQIHVVVAHDDTRVASQAASSGLPVTLHWDPVPHPGTATALAHAAAEINGTLLVTFADTVTSMSLSRLLDAHLRGGAALTMPIQPTDYQLESHMVGLDGDRVIRFLGKPMALGALPNMTFHPYFVVSEEDVDLCRSGEGDFVADVLPAFLDRPGGIQGLNEAELILDCGTPERLARARRLVGAGWLRGGMSSSQDPGAGAPLSYDPHTE